MGKKDLQMESTDEEIGLHFLNYLTMLSQHRAERLACKRQPLTGLMHGNIIIIIVDNNSMYNQIGS